MAAADSLQSLLSSYLQSPSPSARDSLVTSFKSSVLALESMDPLISGDLPMILENREKLGEVWQDAELWESCLVLEALSASPEVRQLTEIVVTQSDVQSLLREWKKATSQLLTFESPSEGSVSKIFEVEEKPLQLLDTVKGTVSYALSRIVTDLPPADLQSLISADSEDYLTLLCKAMEEAYKFLRGDRFFALLAALKSRAELFQGDSTRLPALKLASILLGLLSETDGVDRNQSECVELILSLGQDLHSLLILWRAWFVSIFKPAEATDVHNYSAKGIAVLAELSTRETQHKNLYLPCAFSQLYRLQVYVPIANLVFYTHPSIAVSLLSHAFTHFTGSFRSIKSPFLLVPEGRQSTPQFLRELLDLLCRTERNQQEIAALVRTFISFFTDAVSAMQHRYILLRKALAEHSNDIALGLVVDVYRENAETVPVFKQVKHVLEVLKLSFRKKPPSDYPLTVQSATALFQSQSPSLSYQTVKKLRSKYLDPVRTLLTRAVESNRDLVKVQTALDSLSRAIEQTHEIDN